MHKISGVYCASLTPINEDFTINKDLYFRHCQYLMKQGHDGLAIFGTTGEANSFSIKEKCERCNSTETLTIQHKSHPTEKTYNDFKKKRIRAYTNNNNEIDKTIFTNHVLNDYEYMPILLCPKCKSKNNK